jgi:Poxvirus D5 protein-like
MPIPPTNLRSGILDRQTRDVVQAFAGCLLLPVRPGVNPDSVAAPLAQEVLAPDYRAKLATQSIAVVLGPRSGGIYAIRFEDEDNLATFLTCNPDSRSTLITSHGGRPLVWHRAKVGHRAPLCLPQLTVLMAGNAVVLDRGGLGRPDLILHSATPSAVSPQSIDLGPDPTGTVAVWLTTLDHGELFRRAKHGGLLPNRAVWGNYLVRRLRAHLVYEALEHRFYARTEANDWHPFAEDSIRPWLRELILTAPTGTATAKTKLTDAWLDRLVRRLRSLLPAGALVLHARLRAFARDCLKVERGNDVTVGEMYEAFAVWCRENELPVIPEEIFRKHIAAVLRVDPWFRSRSKSILRESGCQNGFRSLALKRASQVALQEHFLDRNGAVGVADSK